MGIFDMGIWEILLIIVVALIIWGPNKIPEIARTVGKAVGTLKKASQDLTTEIKKELDIEEPESPIKPFVNPSNKVEDSVDSDKPETSDTEQTTQDDQPANNK